MIDKSAPHWTETIRDDTLRMLTAPIALQVIQDQKFKRGGRFRKLSAYFLVDIFVLVVGFPLLRFRRDILLDMTSWQVRVVPLENFILMSADWVTFFVVLAIPAFPLLLALWWQSYRDIRRLRLDERDIQEFLKLYRR